MVGFPRKHSVPFFVPFFLATGLLGFRGFKLMEINSNGCFPGRCTLVVHLVPKTK